MNAPVVKQPNVDISSLRSLLSQKLLPGMYCEPKQGQMIRLAQRCTKEKRLASTDSFLNKAITERSTSKKKNTMQIACSSGFKEDELDRSISFQPTNTTTPEPQIQQFTAVKPHKPSGNFFANENNPQKDKQPQSRGFSFFGKQDREKQGFLRFGSFNADPFSTNAANLIEKLKPKRLKIVLRTDKGQTREERLYRDSDLGVACSFQTHPQGMVCSLLHSMNVKIISRMTRF